MFRGWGMKPGRYEKKQVGIDVDVIMVLLQGASCIGILFVDLCLLGSWLFILPPEVDWWMGVIAFVAIVPMVIAGLLWWLRQWWGDSFGRVIKILLLPLRVLIAAVLVVVMWVVDLAKWEMSDIVWAEGFWNRSADWHNWLVERWADIVLCIGVGVFLLNSLLVILDVVCRWDKWWAYCLSTPDLTVPVPHFQGGSAFLGLGVFIVLVGTTGIMLKPNRYVFGLTSFGGLITTLAQWARPLKVTVAYERPLVLYGLWAVFCLSFIIGSATVFIRFWWKEIPDPYEPEKAMLDAQGVFKGDARSTIEEPGE